LATTPSPPGALSTVNGYPKRTLSRPSGRACCFVFRVPVGYWGTPVGPTPAPRPRRAQAWRHRAALGGALRRSPNRRIARRCQRRRERPELRRVRRLRLRRIGGVRRPSPRRRLPCRYTPLHDAAYEGHSASVAELLLRGADGAVQSNLGYRCAAPHSRNRKPQQPRARRRTPKQWAKLIGTLAEYQAGEREVHSARRLTVPAHPPCLAPHPSPRCLCRRCLPSALADPAGREATAHVELAL
jgi:hypothetical protein